MMRSMERVGLFIDGPNFYATARALGFSTDYRRLLAEFQKNVQLIRAFYYTPMSDEADHVSIRPMVDWLDYNGYTVVTKPVKEFVDSQGRRRFKGNMDIELAVDALELAPHLDRMVLCSGDGDFRLLLAAVQRKGVRTTVVSTMTTPNAMIADELRRQTDEFVDLIDLKPRIAREEGERATPSPQRTWREGRALVG